MFNPDDFPKPTLISVNGVELEVFEAGSENSRNPIVLCHGWPQHAFSWRYQIPALAAAGYHVIVPNQRGYGNSARPNDVTAYDLAHLTGDLVALLDHFGYDDAVFIGHDWGANVVWGMALLHPNRVSKLIALALPYQERGDIPWVELIEGFMGPDNYMVHFNKHPGVADAILDQNRLRFLRNLYRKNQQPHTPEPGMAMINLAKAEVATGEALMTDAELSVLDAAFEVSGFTGSINWYRNLDRNWHLLAGVDPIVPHPALMIYGERDLIPKSPNLSDFVPNVEIVSLDTGHWIQEEKPKETTKTILDWLK
ncbi:alpha/beta hydrolase [Pseudomonas sp. LPB0260]|uniref:alpha/beta fold hydrolase n=1 Tax=Pseudomonas sp. LPB0260 TaxID=2614442 RepID=UPI0015C1EE9B|nr:alpha/beta hydrolase [Pseudomonas sp. LPB0260]QLC73964.1 alpha/beta hydrolase [Pseudomonas sp. LPB0260]QLC76738.1 alpha/beta hydrolase [Pseudomonas sp. LPB0260]